MSKKIMLAMCLFILCVMVHQYSRWTHLSKDELGWANAYEQGDSIFFKSNEGEQDLMVIREKGIWNSLSPFWEGPIGEDYDAFVYIRYVLYHQKDSLVGFFYARKYSKFHPASLEFSVLRASLEYKASANSVLSKVNDANLDDCICIKDSKGKKDDSLAINDFIWSKSRGLVSYKFANGINFMRDDSITVYNK